MMTLRSGLDVVDVSPLSSESERSLWHHARATSEEPADSLVLQLPADEPVDDKLDVEAFIRIWPDLLKRWGSDNAPANLPPQGTDDARIADWVTEMRKIRADIAPEKLLASHGHHQETDPGA